ncbi:MAG: ParA family protein, partial [Candidatus Competibacteraceae bacterium]|nr:ParA family protein [Candidatus Competibacteraceae bacterium]
MTIIGVVNAAGGVAKSTTAANLGYGLSGILAEQNRRVLIIDLDPQGDSASTMLGLRP